MDNFFYNLNDKLNAIRATPEVTHKQLNERDMGKHNNATTGFKALAKKAGGGEKGDKIAGAQFQKMKKAGQLEEGPLDAVKNVAKKVASGINKLVGHGSDEEMRKDLQRKSGAPVTGKKPDQKTTEAAKWRDPKYKDRLYTQEPSGSDDDDYYDYDTPSRPENDPGQKYRMGGVGSEFDRTDPLVKGQGIGRTGIKHNLNTHGNRKGLPSRDQVRSLKGSIKDAHGKHVEPNLPEASAPMTAKQKSFAKLAPPKDKITFADKIAGAKKEVDEMLGDVAADAMRKALGKSSEQRGQQADDDFVNDHAARARNQRRHDDEEKWARSKGRNPNADMDESNAFDYKSPRADAPKVGSIERGHKHDIKHTATGRIVTRRTDDQGNSVGADDDSAASGEKRGRGRPKGTKASIGAKGPSGKSKLMTREGDNESSELKAAMTLLKKSGYKVTKAQGEEQELDEKAVSKKQQKFMGMVHATQKGEKAPSKEVAKVAKTMKKKDAEDFASTKHKGLPEKVKSKKKEEEVEESTTSGSVATSTASTGSKGGVFGKGIYDSMNFELEQMIAESMSINMSDSTEGGKSLTITATDEDALKLGMLLKNAGLGGGDAHGDDMHSHGEESCPTCGMEDCGCGDVQQAVDENAPDWPTNTETSDDALQYAGGLNKPKTDVAGDGQTTIPNTAVHTQDEDALRRMMEMAGIKQVELDPWKETMKEEAVEELDEAKECSTCHKAPCECEEDVEEGFLESIQRMREIAGIKEAKKPDFLDMDKDGDKKEPMTKAIKDKEEKKVEESIFALTNQWKAYRG